MRLYVNFFIVVIDWEWVFVNVGSQRTMRMAKTVHSIDFIAAFQTFVIWYLMNHNYALMIYEIFHSLIIDFVIKIEGDQRGK